MTQMTERMIQVKGWVEEAANFIKKELLNQITVEEKSNRHDLVTNVDKATEEFLVNKIATYYPDDLIIGEEGTGHQIKSLDGRVWIIDPIDGTMNFVKQQENFCIMIGIFENSKPVLGFIYDVMKDEFVYGGAETGVFRNGKPLAPPANAALRGGLVGVNASMFTKDTLHTRKIAGRAIGIRMLGCAGLDFLNVLTGREVAYISNLAPWDFAAGVALAEPLGLVCRKMPNETYDVLGQRQYFIVATPAVFEEVETLFN